MKIGDRIKLRRKELDLSQEDIAVACGWVNGRARVSNYEHNLRTPNTEDVYKLSVGLKCTPQWLLFGVDEEKRGFNTGNDILLARSIPIVKLEDVPAWLGGVLKGDHKQMTVTVTSEEYNISRKAFFVEIHGDSMYSAYNLSDSYVDGDLALVEPDLTPKNGDAVLISDNDSVKIRQLVKDGTENVLKALNPQYPVIKLTPEIKMLGVILITQRKRLKNFLKSAQTI
jgi:SOS-response transcriptional repressor LexA